LQLATPETRVQIAAQPTILTSGHTEMQSFEEIGIRDELLRTLEEEDIVRPTAFQAAVLPALRRGGNLVARTSSGSGKTLAYALGVIDRLEPADEGESEGPRMLVITPTREEAEAKGLALVPYSQATGHRVGVTGAAWGTMTADATIVVAAAADVMEAVQGSALKLDDLVAVVIDGAASILALGGWGQVDALVNLVPRDAQRIVISAEISAPIENFAERRVKRALRYPSEAAIADGRPAAAPTVSVGYLVASESEKLRLLAMQLRGRDPGGPPPIIFCRGDERAADLAERLSIRGFLVGDPGDEDADVAIAAADLYDGKETDGNEGLDEGQTISFDVPADVPTLLARHGHDSDGVILVAPRELAHLKEIARLANLRLHASHGPTTLPGAAGNLEAYRSELRTAVATEDLAAQMLILDPLLEEFTAAELAAAASALLRSRRTTTPTQDASRAAPARDQAAPAGQAPVTWARLYVSVGSRDEIRPGDLVGALAGEANIPGSRIGKIEIRESFSIVEVQADVADSVIRAVNGTTMKGRSLRVDYDRGGPARRPPPRAGGGGSRRTSRPPPGSP